jgi:signal transduction histidine kinase
MAHFSDALSAAVRFKRSIGAALLPALILEPGTTGRRGIRRWLSVLILMGGLPATLALSFAISLRDHDHIRRTVNGEAEAVSRAVQSVVTSHVHSLLRMVRRWEFSKPSMVEWQDEARLVLEHSYGFEVINWMDSSFETRWSVYTGGQKHVEEEPAFGEPREQALGKARDLLAVTVTRAVALRHGGTGVLIYIPIFTGPDAEQFEGFIAAVLNLNSTMTRLLDVNLLRRYNIEILEGGKPIYTKPGAEQSTKGPWAQESDLKLYGVVWLGSVWKIRLWPTPTWLGEIHSSLDRVVLAAGIVLTALLALLTHVFQLAQSRASQLENANAALTKEIGEREQAQTALADFSAMMVHDLRSPIANIISIVAMMREGLFGPVNADQTKWLGKVENTGRTSVELISDFLDLSKLESGRIDLKKQSLDLGELLRTSLDNYSVVANEKRIELEDEIDPRLPPVDADPRRLEQVFNNLISNALKFTPHGGQIFVGARPNGKHVEVWVRDTGVGIPAEEIGQIFEKYKQTTSGATSEHKGTGLGLVICKMIVEAHGGAIRAMSDQGTTFTFTLPKN